MGFEKELNACWWPDLYRRTIREMSGCWVYYKRYRLESFEVEVVYLQIV